MPERIELRSKQMMMMLRKKPTISNNEFPLLEAAMLIRGAVSFYLDVVVRLEGTQMVVKSHGSGRSCTRSGERYGGVRGLVVHCADARRRCDREG